MFPFTKVPFWGYPIFDPQPYGPDGRNLTPRSFSIFDSKAKELLVAPDLRRLFGSRSFRLLNNRIAIVRIVRTIEF